VAAAACVWAAVGAHDWAIGSRENAAALGRQAEEAVARRKNEEDASYRTALQQSWDTAVGRTITEKSEGVAQARAVSTIRALAQQAGLANVSVSPSTSGGAGSVSVLLKADFTWGAFAAFLEELKGSEVAFGTEEISVTTEGDTGATLELRLRAPFLRTRDGA
jgi:hypothetical protein